MKTIQSKIIALLLFSVIFSTCAISTIGIIRTFQFTNEDAQDKMLLLCEKNTEQFNSLFEAIEESVNTLANFASANIDSPTNLNDPLYLANYLEAVGSVGLNHATNTQGAHSAYLAIDYAIISSTQGFHFVKNTETAVFETAPLRSPASYSGDSPQYLEWWRAPKESGKGVWTENLHDQNNLTLSYTVPLYKDGFFFGVVGMDISCSLISEFAGAISIFDRGYAAILDTNGNFLYHPTFTDIDQMSPAAKEEFAIVQKHLAGTDRASEMFSYTLDGEERNLTFAKLQNGMTLLIVAPTQAIFQRQYNLVISLIGTIITIILLTLALSIVFARRFSQPIKQLCYVASQMTMGNLDVPLPKSNKDEIGELEKSLDLARQYLQLQINALYTEAHRDGLTGVGNKVAFGELERRVNEQIAAKEAAFAVAVLDVNRLKIANDVFGHITGDEMLRAICAALRETFDVTDIFRIGGDEFAVYLHGNDLEEIKARMAERVSQMEKLSLPKHAELTLSCALGIATYTKEKDSSFSDVFKRADKRMYKNKAASKKDAPQWQEGSKGIKQLHIDKHLEFLEKLSKNTDDYLFLWDLENDRNYFFGNVEDNYRIGVPGEKTNTMADLVVAAYPADRPMLIDRLGEVFEGERDELNIDYRWTNKNGFPVWVNYRGHVMRDNHNNPLLMLGTVSDTLLKSLYNPLTALFNRDKFLVDMAEKKTVPFTSFMLLDIDNLSDINLQMGRSYGDSLLRLLGKTLESMFPATTLYHMEKDRFAVLLDHCSEETVVDYFERIKESVADKFQLSAAVVPNDRNLYIDDENLYEYAKQLLKEKKENAGGVLTFVSKEDFLNKMKDVTLLGELKHSVDNGFNAYCLHYQPQISTQDYSVHSAEALLRFNSPTRGMISPAEFIPLLERSKLICPVGLWVCESAIIICKKWRESIPDFTISVNFSAIQLREKDIATQVIALLKKHDLPGEALTIEITESVPLEKTSYLRDIFNAFRNAGVQISIDDFGTGYSNLAYLQKLHVNEIKVDRLFTKGIKINSYHYTVVTNILDYAKKNRFRVCLEGIETVEEFFALKALGADLAQGYLFEKPIDAEQFEKRFILSPVTWSFLPDLKRHAKHARLLQFDARDIIKQVNIGLWVIRTSKDGSKKEMLADEKMLELLGIDFECSPEECFRYWSERIKQGYEHLPPKMLADITTTGAIAQVEYPWIHPKHGEISVRCTAKCTQITDDIIVYEGFHRIISNQKLFN